MRHEIQQKGTHTHGFDPITQEARNNGWWTNFFSNMEEVYLLLQKEWKEPGKIVIKNVGMPNFKDMKSCWVDPPMDMQKFHDEKNKTGFKTKHDELYKKLYC